MHQLQNPYLINPEAAPRNFLSGGRLSRSAPTPAHTVGAERFLIGFNALIFGFFQTIGDNKWLSILVNLVLNIKRLRNN